MFGFFLYVPSVWTMHLLILVVGDKGEIICVPFSYEFLSMEESFPTDVTKEEAKEQRECAWCGGKCQSSQPSGS